MGYNIMKWNGNFITDHNRGPVSVGYEVIERKSRMANGTLRKYVVARKHTISTSWEMLPNSNTKGASSATVDGGFSAQDMLTFYKANRGGFELQLFKDGSTSPEIFQVMFTEFNYEINVRGVVDLWTVSVGMEEI